MTRTASRLNAFPIMQYCPVWARTSLKSHRTTSWSYFTQVITCFGACCFAGSVLKAMFSLARTLNWAEFLCSPFDWHAMLTTLVTIRSNGCTQTLTITTAVTGAGIAVTCIVPGIWVYHFMAGLKYISPNDTAHLVSPRCTMLVCRARILGNYCIRA